MNHKRYLRVKDELWYKEQKRARYLANKEKILKLKKERYVAHPRVLKSEDEKRSKRKDWEQSTKEKRNVYMRLWTRKNYKRISLVRKKRYQTQTSVFWYKRLIEGAKIRKHEVGITLEEFSRITSTPCGYCGESKKRIGVDRIDNSKGYIKGNIVAACKICNYMKRSYSIEEFLNHVKKIAKFNRK